MQQLGRQRFVYFIQKRACKGWGESPKHNCKAEPGSRTVLFPLGDSAWNKALPGLPHLFARCGFPAFQSTNCVPAGVFYGWLCTCSKTIKDSVALGRGEGWGAARREVALGKWQELLSLPEHSYLQNRCCQHPAHTPSTFPCSF